MSILIMMENINYLAKKVILKIIGFLKRIFVQSKYYCMDIIPGKKIVINYWLPTGANPGNYNFGDDLNLFLVELITGKKVIPYIYSISSRIKNKINYLCIGSIICQLTNEKSIIWGSGVLSPTDELPQKPLKVTAVRGPLTRDFLLKKGVDCPEIYGDPALLLSRFYQPKELIKKYRMGIIPHYVDKNHPFLDVYRKADDILVLDVQKYGSFKSFINNLCSCQFIASSSLHGLIISDSYSIPNVWVQFSDKIIGGRFKFEDYFLSVKRPLNNYPIVINSSEQINNLLRYKNEWRAPDINLELLLESCPFT